VTTTYYDQTCETLKGAKVITAVRDGIWLKLTVIDRSGRLQEIHFSGRTTKGQMYCGKCGEDRQVETVRDKGMAPRSYCNTCGHHWELVA